MTYRKKLIEVALPLEAINKESAREKSIRHGHPSTLHLWWARRPLAAARAVIFSSLVDDPSSHPEEFSTEEEQSAERQRLFALIEDLVKWENVNNEALLDQAKAEIRKSTDGNPPALLDPFAGGGSIPLEAQRLGLEAHASDLNPVAVMINKAMIEIPPKFAGQAPVNPKSRKEYGSNRAWRGAVGLAEDVRYYGEWMKQEAFKRIGHLYPKVQMPNTKELGGGKATVIAWIWARTVASPDPTSKGAHVPLASSFMLSTRKGKKAWAEVVPDPSAQDGWRFEVKTGDLSQSEEAAKKLGTKAGKAKDFLCVLTGSPIQRSYIQAEGKAGRLSKRLMAIVAEGERERIYISPYQQHEDIAASVDHYDNVRDVRETFLSGNTPTRAMITGGVCSAYGLKTWGHLFTSRQLNALSAFSALIPEVQAKVQGDALACNPIDSNTSLVEGGTNAMAYGQAIGVYLAFVVDKLADRGSSICGWDASREGLRNTFGRQALPMVWDFAEGNPFCGSSGSIDNMLDWVTKAIKLFPASCLASAKQKDAQSGNGFHDIAISTDPPYYDNIGYADLSDYFYVWLRQSLKDTYPEIFKTLLVPKADELVATSYRFNGSTEKARDFFENGMFQAFKQINSFAREDIPVTIYYAFKQSDSDSDDHGEAKTASTGWEAMLSAIIQAGFSITGTWPMRTEMANRAIASGTNALASSIVLVCRKRPPGAPTCTRRDFINTLKRELKPALKELQRSNIAPVDLAQSAIGPGMGVYSRFARVLEADGSPMSVRSALQIINQELDLFFSEQDGELDADSRFCVDLYSQFAFNDMKFGEADVLARAKNTSVDSLASQCVLYAQKGVVHLLERAELPDKTLDSEKTLWLLTQQLTRAMETGGVEACAEIVAGMFSSGADRAKALAYRLFTIAEQKGWAQEAYAYNSLVIAWPDIQARVADIRSVQMVQGKLL